jgi:F-type H+-transporting ATPase subunit epsilon
MKPLLQLQLQTPYETVVYPGLLEITLPGADGVVGILPNHAPMIISLRAGVMRFLKKEDRTPLHYSIQLGVAYIAKNTCLVLVESYSQQGENS